MNHYFKIGKLAASHGLKGDLVLQHSLGKKTSLKGLESIFIEDKKDSFLPYFIESTKIKSDDDMSGGSRVWEATTKKRSTSRLISV